MIHILDLNWERSIPITDVALDVVKEIFYQFDRTITVTGYHAINLGCRNSNFVVDTNQGKFLLRVSPAGEINNEAAAFELIKGTVNVPEMLFHTMGRDKNIFIYQYIKGIPLQRLIIDSNGCNPVYLEQVAEAAAAIHHIPMEKTKGLAEFDVPPFEMWYVYFLDNPVVKSRLGKELHERLQRLVTKKQELIPEIDCYQSFIHCDFRPANMLVDDNQKVYVVDWEMAGKGHSLGDIGQFFRYRQFFQETHLKLFEQTYNRHADSRLPENWMELTLFRDLVNPLQMLSYPQETPLKNADFIKIIENSLMYWNM